MQAPFEDMIRQNTQRLADLKKAAAALERELADARGSRRPDPAGPPRSGAGEQAPGPVGEAPAAEDRTEVLVRRGRANAYRRGLSTRRTYAAAAVACGIVLITTTIAILTRGGASWPDSVATVQSEITTACQNPDVSSEPGEVDFACAKSTQQVLWVFSLLTSDDNPSFADMKSGRIGLEPITPAQGGEVAASLNLHHPYNPASPVDSLQVAARAINDIIGGATVTGANGKPEVIGGLESSPANCVKYTGSAAVISRQGFPDVCAGPLASPTGQAALVADVYRKWMVGAPASAASDAALLFANANNPGDPQVQAVLKHLPD